MRLKDTNREELYSLYLRCFPYFYTEEEAFGRMTDSNNKAIFAVKDKKSDDTVGFSLVSKNSIQLICVDEAHRKKGYGTILLMESEDFIRQSGFNRIILGDGDMAFFQGVPMVDVDGSYGFFERHGYTKEWESIDMIRDLSDYENHIQAPEGITFKMACDDTADNCAILDDIDEAVAAVDEQWRQYFKGLGKNTLLAVDNGCIVAFLLLSDKKANLTPKRNKKVGDIGCVGTIPSARNAGIGLSMVAYATQLLKNRGCDMAYIGCTYLESWYGRLGYRTWMRFWMGAKI